MNGKVHLCDGEKTLDTVDASETIQFHIKEPVHITHLLINFEGKKPVKYVNEYMPADPKAGDTIELTNFITYLEKAGVLVDDVDQKTNLVP